MKTENYLTLSALDLKSLLTRVDVLFYWNHWNPYLSNFLGKRKLVPKIGVWEIRGKITVFDWGGGNDFCSSYREVWKGIPLNISLTNLLQYSSIFLKSSLAKNFKAPMNPDPRRRILPVLSNNKLFQAVVFNRVASTPAETGPPPYGFWWL